MSELISPPVLSASTMPPPDASTLLASLDFGALSKAKTETATDTGQITPGDKSWYTYWTKKAPEALSLVWEKRIQDKTTFYENLKTNTPVYYSFKVSLSGEADEQKLTAFSDAQKESAKQALAELSKATGVEFLETSNSKQAAGIVFALSSSLKTDTLGQQVGQTVNNAYQSTILLNSSKYGADSLTPGGEGFETLLHELGHAAGLDDAGGKVSSKMDDSKYTVMAYEGKGADGTGSNKTYAKLDLEALEALYPKELRQASNNTVMADFSPNVSGTSPQEDEYSTTESFMLSFFSANEEAGASSDPDVLLTPLLNAIEESVFTETLEEILGDPDSGLSSILSVIEESDEFVREKSMMTASLHDLPSLEKWPVGAAWTPVGGLTSMITALPGTSGQPKIAVWS